MMRPPRTGLKRTVSVPALRLVDDLWPDSVTVWPQHVVDGHQWTVSPRTNLKEKSDETFWRYVNS